MNNGEFGAPQLHMGLFSSPCLCISAASEFAVTRYTPTESIVYTPLLMAVPRLLVIDASKCIGCMGSGVVARIYR